MPSHVQVYSLSNFRWSLRRTTYCRTMPRSAAYSCLRRRRSILQTAWMSLREVNEYCMSKRLHPFDMETTIWNRSALLGHTGGGVSSRQRGCHYVKSMSTVCPISLYPFCIVKYYIKLVNTSWKLATPVWRHRTPLLYVSRSPITLDLDTYPYQSRIQVTTKNNSTARYSYTWYLY